MCHMVIFQQEEKYVGLQILMEYLVAQSVRKTLLFYPLEVNLSMLDMTVTIGHFGRIALTGQWRKSI